MQTADKVRVTKKCHLCGQELHLVQDYSGSYWMHERAYPEWVCRNEHRAEYERLGFEL